MISKEQSIKNKIKRLKKNPLEGEFTCECGFSITGKEITDSLITDNPLGIEIIATKRYEGRHWSKAYQNKHWFSFYTPCNCPDKGISRKEELLKIPKS